jgi:redox-sensitive bicupin YhaK (pirin superfamily)
VGEAADMAPRPGEAKRPSRHAAFPGWNDASRIIAPMDANSLKIIDPRAHDLGGFSVRRVLPHINARHVGPFVFFDHMGPAAFPPGQGIDVRPHPHIGLATVTYLFEGAIEHRDSLGFVQTIRPGDVNWMTAGSGIVHSERSPAAERAAGHTLHGIQVWVALPQDAEETEPSFHHHGADALPRIERDGVAMRLVIGSAFGLRSPVLTFSEMFYLGAAFEPGSALSLPPEHAERAVYVAAGALEIGGQAIAAGQLAVLPPGADVVLRAPAATRAILFGGAPLDGERHLWWNFVASSRERIERAKDDWRAGNFGGVPGETEFIPLPE